MTLGDIIKNYRGTHKLSMDAFSEKSGISKAYISLLEKNKHPKTGKAIAPSIQCIKQAADGMGMDFNILFGMIDGNVNLKEDIEKPPKTVQNKLIKEKRGVTINVLGRVAAGIPIEAVEDIIDTEEISEALASTGEFFGLLIDGDSMEPDIHKGDTVIVRQQNDAESGEIVIAMVNGGDATCKRLIKYAEGISLVSLNNNYAPMFFSNKDVAEKPVRIIGKVVESRRKW